MHCKAIRVLFFFLFFFLFFLFFPEVQGQEAYLPYQVKRGAIVRGNTAEKELALVFTGDEYADGGMHIAQILDKQDVKASFFLTGKFYRNPDFKAVLDALVAGGHYLGAHSDQHLLYCSWEKRDSLLLTKEQFSRDLLDNYRSMLPFGSTRENAPLFLPPYEWYNDSISAWTASLGLQLVNFTHGTLSHVDYTLPGDAGYRGSREIYASIMDYESRQESGLNGFILLSHIGTAPQRSDKFHLRLEELIRELKSQGYRFKRIDELLDL